MVPVEPVEPVEPVLPEVEPVVVPEPEVVELAKTWQTFAKPYAGSLPKVSLVQDLVPDNDFSTQLEPAP